MANTTKNGKVYDSTGKYLGSSDIVYGTGPSSKNINKGITTGLDSDATENSQPSKNFNAGSNTIDGANPSSPSTNNITRQEKYNIENGNNLSAGSQDLFERIISDSGQGTSDNITKNTTNTTKTDTSSNVIKEKTGTFSTEGGNDAIRQIQNIYKAEGIDGLKKAYGELNASTYEKLLQNMYNRGALTRQAMGVISEQSPNVQAVLDLAQEVDYAVALGYTDAHEIAERLGQEDRVIQKILSGKENELVELTDQYKEQQLRDYYRKEEDLGTQIARNMEDYKNAKTHADYQFNSTMEKLERQLFDAQWNAKETSGIYGMTGTQYVLDKIKKEYQQQMDDVEENYQYNSVVAQLSINRALEDYATNMERLGILEDEQTKAIQTEVLKTMTQLNNQIGLTVKEQKDILTSLQTSIAKMQNDAFTSYLQALEDGNSTLASALSNAYGITIPGTGTMRTERNNNPTAMTTDVAKSLGAKLGVDYVQGDSFVTEDGKTLYTAKLIGDPVETTIRIFDNAAANGIPIFYTQKGAKRWKYMGMTNDEWTALTEEQKKAVIESMLQHEGGSLSGMSYYAQFTTATSDEIKAAQDIYDAELQIMEDYKSFQKHFSAVSEETWNTSIWDIVDTMTTKEKSSLRDWVVEGLKGYMSIKADISLKDALGQAGIKTVRDLFSQAANPNFSQYEKAGMLLQKVGDKNLDLAVKELRQITNKNFLESLITAKGRGATFGNLTEAEGEKISEAWNDIASTLGTEAMYEQIEKAMGKVSKDIAKLEKLYGNKLGGSSKQVSFEWAEEEPTDEEIINEIVKTYPTGSGTTINSYLDLYE